MRITNWDSHTGLVEEVHTGQRILLPALWGLAPTLLTDRRIELRNERGLSVTVNLFDNHLSIVVNEVDRDSAD